MVAFHSAAPSLGKSHPQKPTVAQNDCVIWARRPWYETGHICGGWPGERAPGDTTATHYPNSARSTALERCHGAVTSLPCKIYPHSLNCAVLTRGSGDEFPTISVCKLFGSNGLQQDFIYGALTCQAEPPIRHFGQATILRLSIYYSWEQERGILCPLAGPTDGATWQCFQAKIAIGESGELRSP